MFIKRSISGFAVGAALLMAASSGVSAAVTLDDNGFGFVGKGDVQLAFGWNDPALQANAGGVSFTYDATDNYTAVCTWTTGEGTRGEQTHNGARNRSATVNSAVSYEARKNSQLKITGFNLLGFGDTTTTGSVPEVGGPCPGNAGTGGTWSSVDLVSSSGGLVVHHGVNSAQIG